MVDHRRVRVMGLQVDLPMPCSLYSVSVVVAAGASRRVIAWIGGCVPGQVPRAGGTRAP